MTYNRAPIKYGVQPNTPIRIAGSSDPPYRLINIGVEGVAWVSDNAGLRAGEGTPINPGTSFLWVRPAELYAVAETVPVTLILTTEIEDWQPDPAAIAVAILNSGVLVIDNPVALFSDTLDGGNGFDTGLIDVSRFQSLSVVSTCNALGGGNIDGFRVQFYHAAAPPPGTVSPARDIEYTGVGEIWMSSLPVIGRFVRAYSLTATQVILGLFGSHRPQESIEQSAAYSATTPSFDLWFAPNATAILAGTSFLSPLFSPWFGDLELQVFAIQGVSTALLIDVQRLSPVTGAFVTVSRYNLPPLSGVYSFKDRFACMGGSYRFAFTAIGGDIPDISTLLTPVSGYGVVA